MYRVRGLIRAAAAVCVAGSFTFSNSLSSQAQGSGMPASWSGFYVGFHGSYMGADQDFPGAPPHVPSPVPVGVKSGPPRMGMDGGMLGGQVGAQYHFQGGFVVGVEADFSRGGMSDTLRDGNFIVQTGEIEWTGSLRARLGLPMGNFMPFVTAGYMWAGARYTQSCPDKAAAIPVSPTSHCATADKYTLSDSQTHMGLVYGGGLEWAVSRSFTLKAEGLFFRLSDEDYELGTAPLSGVKLTPKPIEYDGMLFRLGGSYRFN